MSLGRTPVAVKTAQARKYSAIEAKRIACAEAIAYPLPDHLHHVPKPINAFQEMARRQDAAYRRRCEADGRYIVTSVFGQEV